MIFQKLKFWKACSTKISSWSLICLIFEIGHEKYSKFYAIKNFHLHTLKLHTYLYVLPSIWVCICVGDDISETGVDIEITEITTKEESYSDEGGFNDETGIDDEISSEIQELTAKESHEVSNILCILTIYRYMCTQTFTDTLTHNIYICKCTYMNIHVHVCTDPFCKQICAYTMYVVCILKID